MKRIVFLTLVIVCMVASLRAQESSNYPIDNKLEECMATDSNQTTYGTIGCLATAVDEWDAELNRFYKLLKESLNPELQEKLKIAQREWILYRDKEIEFMSTLYTYMDGSMYRIFAVERQMSITRQRTLDLMSYYDTITMGEN